MKNCSIALDVKEPTPCPSLKGRGDRLSWLRHLLLIAALQVTITSPSLAANPPSLQGGVGGRLDNDTLTILFTGDILLDRGVRHVIERHGFHTLFADDSLRSLLKGANFVVGNLECPATTINQPAFKRFVFRGEPQWLDSLRAYGFTHLNLANNHSVDQGRDG